MKPPESANAIPSSDETRQRRRSSRHHRHSSPGKRLTRFLQQCAWVLIQALAVALAGAIAMIVTQPEEAAHEVARIVFAITGSLALIGFSIAQWRKGR